MAERSRFAKSLRSPWQWGGVLFILLLMGASILASFFSDPKEMLGHHESPILEKVRFIDLLLFSYANDNGGKYPTGKSSTEVFQKLIDEKYISDPAIFYYELPGKIKPTSNQLKPENVSWDVTIPLDIHDSDYLPVVVLTGFKINYVPGGSAQSLPMTTLGRPPGIAVAYKSYSATFLKISDPAKGVVFNVISEDFNSSGKKYQQLTPNGPLAP